MRAKHLEEATLIYRGRLWAAIFWFFTGLLCAGPAVLLAYVIVAAPLPHLLALVGFCAMITLPLMIVLPLQAWAEMVSRVELTTGHFLFVLPHWRGFVPLPPARTISGPWTSVRAIRRRSFNLRWGWVLSFGYDEYLISTASGDVTLIETWQKPSSSRRGGLSAAEIAEEVARRSDMPIRPAAEVDRGGFTRAILAKPPPWRDD